MTILRSGDPAEVYASTNFSIAGQIRPWTDRHRPYVFVS